MRGRRALPPALVIHAFLSAGTSTAAGLDHRGAATFALEEAGGAHHLRHSFHEGDTGHGEPSHSPHEEGAHDTEKLSYKCRGGALAIAIGLLSAVVLIPVILYMAADPGRISDLVLKLVDTSVTIFLAVLWFNAFSDLLEYPAVHDLFKFAEEVFAVTQVVLLYVVVMWISYLWRDKEVRLVTFGSCGAHYVAFAGIRATGEVQYEASKIVGTDYGHIVSFFVCGMVFALLVCIFKTCHICWTGKMSHNRFDEVVTEVELDIMGLTGSFALTQALRHWITGEYPASAHLLQLRHAILAPGAGPAPAAAQLLASGRACGRPHHAVPAWQGWFMLGWSLALTAASALGFTYLGAWAEQGGSLVKKTAHIVKVVLVMCIAWGYLLWGEWMFKDALFGRDPMVGKMCFAVAATIVSLCLVWGLVRLHGGHWETEAVQQTVNVSITGASLVTAWAWEHCFDQALHVIGQRYEVGHGGLVPKAILAISIPFAVLPFYVTYVKPRVMEAQEREMRLEAQASVRRAESMTNVRGNVFSAPEHRGAFSAPVARHSFSPPAAHPVA